MNDTGRDENKEKAMAKKMPSREEMLALTRKKMQERSQGRKDPDEFRCPLAKGEETLEFYFKVLPALIAGDTCKSGVDEAGAPDGLWYYENGAHFLDRVRYECPRCHDNEPCAMCQFGFDLMQDSNDKAFRQRVAKTYLARSYYAVNIYFLNNKKNPEKLRGQVFWYNAPKTVWDVWDACIQSDDPGDPEEPRACGMFFHPWEGTYTFKLIAKKKGDYNTYEGSAFLPATLGPLAKLQNEEPDDEAIDRILSQRHILPAKFNARDPDKLEELLAKLSARESGKKETESIPVGKGAASAEADVVEEPTKAAPPKSGKQSESKKQKEFAEKQLSEESVEDEPTKAAPAEETIEEEPAKPSTKAAKASKPAKAAAQAEAKEETATATATAEAPDDEVEDELKGLLNTLDDEEE
jgi:hypothetical protein